VSFGSPFLLLIQNSGVNEAELAGLYNFQALMHALRLPSSMTFFTQNPFYATYFLPTAAKSRQKMPPSKQCSSSTNFLIFAGRNNSFQTSYFSIAYPCD
jgi:hypothetical protein